MNFFKKLIDSEYRELSRFSKIADDVVALEDEYSKLTDEQLKVLLRQIAGQKREIKITRK